MSNDTKHSICAPFGASIGTRLRNILMMLAFLLSVGAHLRTLCALCAAFLLSACATQSTKTVTVDVPVATRVTVNVPARPHLPIAEISTRDSAGRRMERYSETIELLMGYAMQLECLLKPYATQPDLVPCNEAKQGSDSSANYANPPKASAKPSAKTAPKPNVRLAPMAQPAGGRVKKTASDSKQSTKSAKSTQSSQSAEPEGSPDSRNSRDLRDLSESIDYLIPPL